MTKCSGSPPGHNWRFSKTSQCPPAPVGDDPFEQHDHVARLLFTIDDEATETVALEPRHHHVRLESVRRSERRTRAAS
jgi:hypothetical protein